MKKNSTILDFFKAQPQNNTTCPACGILIFKSKLNEHLDTFCSSALNNNAVLPSQTTNVNIQSSRLVPCKSGVPKSKTRKDSPRKNRLCLKGQKKSSKNVPSLWESKKKETEFAEDNDIILIEEISCHRTVENVGVLNCVEKQLCKKATPTAKRSVSQISACSSSQITLNKQLNFIESNEEGFNAECISVDSSSQIDGKINAIESSEKDSNTERFSVDSTSEVIFNKQFNFSELSEKDSRSECVSASSSSQITSNKQFNFSESNVKDFGTECLKTEDFSTSEIFVESKVKVSPDKKFSFTESKKYSQTKCIKSESFSTSEVFLDSNIKVSSSLETNLEEKNLVSQKSEDFFSDAVAILNDADKSLEVDNNVFSQSSQGADAQSHDNQPYSPYYIANFKHILNTVLAEEDNRILFNDEDMNYVKSFESLSTAAQKLYVRLFQRKYKWLRLNKINYPDITKDPAATLEELVKSGLVDSGIEKIDLETGLELLSLPEARNLIKHFNFNSSGKSKTDIVQILLKHCKEHKSVFFTNGVNSISITMLKKVKQMMGDCYRIAILPKRLFTRILMLFSLPTISEDDEEAAGGQQQQLLTLLQVNKGELKFPEIKRTRGAVIFSDRDDLIRYEEARQLENDILNAVENKSFELAKDLYINAKEEFEHQCTCPYAERASSLPAFLKRYTSFHVYVRCMTQGVEILQRLRQYEEAVLLLKQLLNQKVFCLDYHGRWWDRMALNLEQHLKQPQNALTAIKKGLKDKNVRKGHRYSLLTRALRIIKSVQVKESFKKILIEEATVIEAPKIVIRGRLFPRAILGRRHVFISSSSNVTDEDDITVLGVEQLAIEHYKNEGYIEGIHGEGSTFISLYSLFFWDIIYDGNILDVFISPYQTHPLDLNSDSFFPSRESQILSHLETLRQSTLDDLKDIVKTTWELHFGEASLVAWDRFVDVEHVQGLVGCLGNHIISGICERLARDFRFTRSGVPDLVVWNPETGLVKIVEVKGPGDKLSSKQILWLDYLIKLGADAEVCLVEAVGSKKLRRE